MQFVPDNRQSKTVYRGAKKHLICYIKYRVNDESIGFFCNHLDLKLHKIWTIEAISKIQNAIGLLAYPL